jgi:hypothetical protein
MTALSDEKSPVPENGKVGIRLPIACTDAFKSLDKVTRSLKKDWKFF